ncbi:MAG: XRE family transcriptional regulator [Pseudomonadota bacterium]
MNNSRSRNLESTDDPAHAEPLENALEQAIGRQVRYYRKQLGMNLVDLGKATDLSQGMISKIENGLTSPSLATISALSSALNVPVTALFRTFDEQRDAVHVKSGEGLTIERRGTRAGHQYQLLGHSLHGDVAVEPYLITLTESSEVFPLFQHEGIEFIHVLSGSLKYRHGESTYHLEPGDSLFFDADVPHGPDELVTLPVRFLSVMSHASTA